MQAPSTLIFGDERDSALTQAAAIAAQARQHNFFWDGPEAVHEKVLEELHEVLHATGPEHREEELGDALFTLACLSYAYGVDPEQALRKANAKLVQRWQKLYELALQDHQDPRHLSAEAIAAYWSKVKECA